VTNSVVVVGAGNAGLCAALAAADAGADVTVIEVAGPSERGGNSAFTGGLMRVAFNDVDDLRVLMPDLGQQEIEKTDFGSYPASAFLDDVARVTGHRCDPDLTEILVSRSLGTLAWMRSKGVRFVPAYGRQAFNIDGKFTFWGGAVVETSGGGRGLIASLFRRAEAQGISILYEHRAIDLLTKDGCVCGVAVSDGRHREEIRADSVVLASGGFQSNPEWRARYLGPGWDLARVRGTRFNVGDGIRMALDIGAAPWGHWSGCHAVAWDFNAPLVGNLDVGDGYQKHSYPFGIMVNAHGERFVDEGADFRNYTYARYGHEILGQPGQMAWQVFDSKVTHLLRDEYRIRQVSKVSANSLEELARRMEGIDVERFLQTVAEFNNAVDESVPFNPNVKDGRTVRGLKMPKSNWANKVDAPPYEAYSVTCGITFTFGGLKITPSAEVLDVRDVPIPGLYACGELVGGIFYFNYPGGTGLTSGAVFGRIAGAGAAGQDAPSDDGRVTTRLRPAL
jgi:tricarballylate dehydrogenase